MDWWGSQDFLVLLASKVAQVLKVYLVSLDRMAYLGELDQEEPKGIVVFLVFQDLLLHQFQQISC